MNDAGGRPLRFGVISSGAADGPAWRSQARRAEALGYSTLFMPDHFQEQWAPIVGLTIAAEATERLNVGTLVFDNDYRHPVVLAKEMATLDLATEGRLEFGLGAGWRRSDYEGAGLDYDPPGQRIERMSEGLEVMKALWASAEPVTFTGKHYRIDGAVGTPRPRQTPHPKICIGGGGKRILSIAAQHADIIGINPTLTKGELGKEAASTATPNAFDEKVAWVRQAAGARFAAIELQSHCAFVMITPQREKVIASMAPMFGVTEAEAIDLPLTLIGTVDQLCETIERRRHRWGFTYWVVPDTAMEDFAPVVDRLAGR